ncbi:hypothetical protein K437DRAFT_259548 [Tilletiaria anomala UBC 951]|uniref:CFA20 domain-containing protein n=1 Tax=Tilletiaria anomala (strain ATCC 24038 / CBS 436.72 / UBC 951) TaxID=1037660 RepID=A0A066VHH9_TILAU|nr:uncharacterized protein K437DRAFT_259548 [Tilletiaria anomala UBC 951]KDN38035.1 hypothetical protein K437DRAFT_259548 [Tilletiaria anomala UBC 951]
MFNGAKPPSPLTLFTSTSSAPLTLFSVHADRALPEDSGAVFLYDDTDQQLDSAENDPTRLARDVRRFKLCSQSGKGQVTLPGADGPIFHASSRPGRRLSETVLHLQSPNIKATMLRCPPLGSSGAPTFSPEAGATVAQTEMALEGLPFLHLHLAPLDGIGGRARPLSLEVGVRDARGQLARIRASTFQRDASLYLPVRNTSSDMTGSPLLHLPLDLPTSPAKDPTALTAWSVMSLPLHRLIKLFNNSSLQHAAQEHISSHTQQDVQGQCKRIEGFKSIAYIHVHANVRLRRIWCTSDGSVEPGKTNDPESKGFPEFWLVHAA